MQGLSHEVATALHHHLMQNRWQESQQRLNRANELARVTLESIGDGVIITDTDNTIQFINPIAENMTGWPAQTAIGKKLSDVFSLIGTQTIDSLPYRQRSMHDPSPMLDNLTLRNHKNGDLYSVELRISAIIDSDNANQGSVLVFHDVTTLRELAKNLSHQARHDALTGLYNRYEFDMQLKYVLQSAHQKQQRHCVCFMDLDQFKIVNDSCGHLAGDQLLTQVAQHLKANLRNTDILARLGGDEFGLILVDCNQDTALSIANKLVQSMKEFRFTWNDRIFTVGISIGLLPIDASSGELKDVIAMADAACYQAKNTGRNRVHVARSDDLAVIQRQGDAFWLHYLRDALEQDGFVLYQQMIKQNRLESSGEETLHSEILLRMRDEQGAIVKPDHFLPTAERYHLMPQVDRWVVNKALNKLQETLATTKNLVRFSINLSGQSLADPVFAQYVSEQIDSHAFPKGSVCFEITETAAISNLDQAVRFMHLLKEKGCLFALDDFGSGLSSFNYLKNLPVDFLKIDGSFINDIVSNPVDRAMVASIHEIGSIMGVRTIAEYVSSGEIQETLLEIGIDYIQGNHIQVASPFP